MQIDFDDADEEEADDIQEDEEPREEGETDDVEINVTDKMIASEKRAEEEERLEAMDSESEGDVKPEVVEPVNKAEVKDVEEDSKMDVDETVEDRSDSVEIIKADAIEESTVKETKEVGFLSLCKLSLKFLRYTP